MKCPASAHRTALNQHFPVIGQRGGEEVGVAAFCQLQAFTQFGNGRGEVAHGEVGPLFRGGQLLDFFLAEAVSLERAELPPGKVGDKFVGSVKVAVGMQLFHLIYLYIWERKRKAPAFRMEAFGS